MIISFVIYFLFIGFSALLPYFEIILVEQFLIYSQIIYKHF